MLNPRITSFFKVFDQCVQEEIMNFCRRITATNADVYIFMARKAASFCDCLEELGLIHLDGYVTSDRVLDIDGKWLSGKSIVIIDDAVVSGTTLYKTIKKLEQYGVSKIEVQILTINKRWYNAQLLEDECGKSYVYPVFNKLPDNVCIKLCNDIVRSISIVPRPYDIDFPLYKSIQISELELKRILVLNNWEVYDLRTDLQIDNDIINFTLIPNKQEIRNFSKISGVDFAKNSIVKIRLYGRIISKYKKVCSLKISPLVVFEENDIKIIQQMFENIITSSSITNPNNYNTWSSSSQLRFLQFYYSHILAQFWLHRINHLVSVPVNLVFSYRNLSFLFPETCISDIQSICNNIHTIPDSISTNKALVKCNKKPVSVYKTIDPISLNARLYEPFIDMYHDKELPCRELVLEKGKEVFYNKKYQNLRNRLDQGISYQDLLERVRDSIDSYNSETAVSLFIDYSIDAGIIVPIIQQKGSSIYRAYRHGEDVLFGRREEMMYTKMLSLFSKCSGTNNGITRISAEKLIVLFSKIGLRKKILYPYTSNFIANPLDSNGKPMKILRVKPYLKGPVAILGSALQHQRNKNIPFITNERKGMWLTNILVQNGCLKPNSNHKKYNVVTTSVDKDLSLLTDAELAFVENFAELLGRISNPDENTGVCFSDNDWAKISTTLTMPDTATAVAAEMEIFYNHLDITNLVSLTNNKKSDLESIKYFATSYSFEGVNSALMKIKSFKEKNGQALIKSVKFASAIEQRIWLDYFSEELNNNSDDNNQHLCSIFYEQQVWAYVIAAIVNSLYILLVKRYEKQYGIKATTKDKLSRAKERLESSLKMIEKLKTFSIEHTYDANKLFDIFDNLSFGTDYDLPVIDTYSVLINQFFNAIEQSEPIASNIKETVCDILGVKGKISEIIRYNYVIHINLDSCPEDRIEHAYLIIESAYKKELSKIKNLKEYLISKGSPIPDICIEELPQKHKPEPISRDGSHGIWYIAHGPKIDEQMINFAMNIFYKLYINNIDCKVTIFDGLSYDACIKSNSNEYAEYHCNQFGCFIEQFKKDVLFPSSKKGPCLTHVCANNRLTSSKAKAKLEQTIFYQIKESNEIFDSVITKVPYTVTNYTCTAERNNEYMEHMDFGIITILPEELDAIKKTFNMKREPTRFGERYFYSSVVYSDETRRTVVCTQTINQGELSVMNAYNDLINKYHPKMIFLVGIAGGISGHEKAQNNTSGERLELDLCDVIIAKSVIDYELRKETNDGIEHRGQIYNIDAAVASVVNDFLVTLQTEKFPAVNGSKNTHVNILFDAIGSGNAVITNNLSETTSWLKTVNSKVAAVEMEATGISSSFYEATLNNSGVQGLMVVRGISDLANTEKSLCKQYRNPAAQNAALVTKKLIEIFPDF